MKNTTVVALSAIHGRRVVDVREPDEYAGGHVPGAVNIPLGQIPDRLGEFAPGAVFYLVCELGGRSARATEYLTTNGVDAINVDGGTSAWISAGYPTN